MPAEGCGGRASAQRGRFHGRGPKPARALSGACHHTPSLSMSLRKQSSWRSGSHAMAPAPVLHACKLQYPSNAAVLKTLAAAVLPHCISACLAGDLAHRRTGRRVVHWCEDHNVYAICLELEPDCRARAAHQAPGRRAAAASPGQPSGVLDSDPASGPTQPNSPHDNPSAAI